MQHFIILHSSTETAKQNKNENDSILFWERKFLHPKF